MNRSAISIGTTFNYEIPLKEQLPLIKKTGFTHISLAGGNLEHSNYLTAEGQKSVKEMVGGEGLGICSIHAPFFKQYVDISSCDKNEAARSLEVFKKCIDAALFLNANVIVFHPCPMNIDMPEARQAILVDQIKNLIRYIGKEKIKLSIENLPSMVINNIVGYSLENIADDHYGFCYDSSHDILTKQPLEILKKYGHRLVTAHIADNHGQKDDHVLPFEGVFPWDEFCKLFGQIDFKGIFLLEVEMRESVFKIATEFLAEAYTRGIKLLNQIEGYNTVR